MRPGIAPSAIEDLLGHYIKLHEQEAERAVDYQGALSLLKEMHTPLEFIVRRYKGTNDNLDRLIGEFGGLTYTVAQQEDDEIPF